MTREEILAVPAGREMDALIAEKVLGWGVLRNDIYVYIPRPNEAPDERLDELKWYPSNDIAAAWDVVEKFMPYKSPSLYVVGVMWYCFFALKTGEGLFTGTNILEARASTAPLAICRAALLAALEDRK